MPLVPKNAASPARLLRELVADVVAAEPPLNAEVGLYPVPLIPANSCSWLNNWLDAVLIPYWLIAAASLVEFGPKAAALALATC